MADFEQLTAADLVRDAGDGEPVYIITPSGAFLYADFVQYIEYLAATEQYDELRALGCEPVERD